MTQHFKTMTYDVMYRNPRPGMLCTVMAITRSRMRFQLKVRIADMEIGGAAVTAAVGVSASPVRVKLK